MLTNPTVLSWLEGVSTLAAPEKEVWIDGSREQFESLRQTAEENELLLPLNAEELPQCYLHRTTVAEAAKAEERTFLCTRRREDAGVTANWEDPDEMLGKLRGMFGGVMRERTMYIIPFLLGGRPGLMITDDLYVTLNTIVLTECGNTAVEALNALPEDGCWFKGAHSSGTEHVAAEDNRYICHFPEENAVWAINTGFGAGAFLTKEAFSLSLASHAAVKEGWLAAHMAILEVNVPGKEPFYIGAAFPAGCGKTALAMMKLPQSYEERGYSVRCIGDDVAWLRKGADGKLRAINPEKGLFGLAPGLDPEKMPNVYAAAKSGQGTFFTNTAYKPEDGTVWWEGICAEDESAVEMLDWKGNPWSPPAPEPEPEIPDEPLALAVSGEPGITEDWSDMEDDDDEDDEAEDLGDDSGDDIAAAVAAALSAPLPEPDEEDEPEAELCDGDPEAYDSSDSALYPKLVSRGAHSNSRFTAPLSACPNLSDKAGDSEGVPLSAIIFGGKRTKTIPLVYQAFDWAHGVFLGSSLGTEVPGTGLGSNSAPVWRDSMAMLSHCGVNIIDYWRHWYKIGRKLGRNAPKIFVVNWFKANEYGRTVWPGYGENIRVLDWIVRRVTEKCPIAETAVGYQPKPEDIDVSELKTTWGKDFTTDHVRELLYVDKNGWKEDVNSVKQFYAKFGDKLPTELKDQLVDLEKRLLNS